MKIDPFGLVMLCFFCFVLGVYFGVWIMRRK